jgi:long-chain fatty acid transport protein
MKNILHVVASAAIVLLLMVSHASAAGFALPEQGAAAMGMGSAFVGQADDASAVWYNPAGITQLDGIRAMAGAVFIYPTFSHDNNDGTTDTASRNIHTPALFYATYKLNDWVAFGLGVNNPFGLATDWHLNSETAQVATLTQLISTEFNPNVAVKITDRLSLAAGPTYVYLAATLAHLQLLPSPPFPPNYLAYAQMSGSGNGVGGDFSALYKISDTVSTGISYRSRIKVEINGNAQVSSPLYSTYGNASTSITLPDMLTWGFSAKPTNKLTLNFDLGYTWWSTYNTLSVNSTNNPAFDNQYPKQWKDVMNVRIGGQYALTDNWKLRAGLQYDQNPVPDHYFETLVPDADRYGISVGTGYSIGNLTIDVAYLYLLFETRNVGDNTYYGNSVAGSYHTNAQCLGVSVAYKF